VNPTSRPSASRTQRAVKADEDSSRDREDARVDGEGAGDQKLYRCRVGPSWRRFRGGVRIHGGRANHIVRRPWPGA
jgi:hypothetical protein